MLSYRIAQLRGSSGLNQAELAQKLHVSPSTIGMYEQGRRMPNVDILIQMSKLFNVSLDFLITGSEFSPSAEALNRHYLTLQCPCIKCCHHRSLSTNPKNY